ncbi:ATP-grasp domain-containing protein [Cupriavidus basilensis]
MPKSIDEVKTYATNILGMQLVTHQTGPEGKKVNRLLIEEGADIKKELYRFAGGTRVAEDRADGIERRRHGQSEEVAAHSPEKIHTLIIEPSTGLDRR